MAKPCWQQTAIDLTHPFTSNMPVHPYDTSPSLVKTKSLEHDGFNDWTLHSGMHAGTHIDGPGHLTQKKILLSSFDISRFVGPGYLIDARARKTIDKDLLINIPEIPSLILLIMTGSDKLYGKKEYFTEHPVITPDFANSLMRYSISMVGIDSCSPDRHPFEIHKIFFDNNILIAENLTNLDKLVGTPSFTVVALPLSTETDSAMARIIALVP